MLQLILQFIFSALAAVAFGILTNVKKQLLQYCAIIGGISWCIYYLCLLFEVNVFIASFVSSFCIQMLSLITAKRVKVPGSNLSVAALVSIVPGGTAYEVVRYLVESNDDLALDSFIKLVAITASISIGFLIASFVIQTPPIFGKQLIRKD